MGTDLKLMVEVRHGDEDWHPLMNSTNVYEVPRNYSLFALLADVRNGSNRHEPTWQEPHQHELPDGTEVEIPGYWYDIDDGGQDKIEYIDTPRGVPADASLQWKAHVAIWEARRMIGSVECTWLSPKEIVEANWDQHVIRHGLVPEDEYLAYVKNGTLPKTHAAGAGGDGVLVVNEVEYAAGRRGENYTVVDCRWNAGPLREMSDGFLDVIEEIEGNRPDGAEVRFMLLFES